MKVIVVGSSSGGPKALEDLLSGLSPDLRAAVIVIQHLPLTFTISLAKRLNKLTKLPLTHMTDREVIKTNHIYIVPGDKHFFITSPSNESRLIDAHGLTHPSINMGFTSVAECFGPDTIGVILTGMGDDGTIGAKAIKQVSGRVIAQDEASSVVFGMPRAVQIAGFADEVLPLDKIAHRLSWLTSEFYVG
ncbi:MAG: CheB methylesterase domain-containing protein [Parcubacteria group bacterium]|jgi:two-component system chemotaxis response regulator CheB